MVVPRTVAQAHAMDKQNGNLHWYDTMEKEISTSIAMNLFTFHKLGHEYKRSSLHMVFDVKEGGTYKARLLVGGAVP